MSKLSYVKGDLFASLPGNNVLIPHVCNDIGGWGAGFVVAVSQYDRSPEEDYRTWFKGESPQHICASNRSFGLSETQISAIGGGLNLAYVANMVAQHKLSSKNGRVPIRYWALVRCMMYVQHSLTKRKEFKDTKGIWCPKFGAGLAGGKWDVIETLIKEIWVDAGIPVTVFEL